MKQTIVLLWPVLLCILLLVVAASSAPDREVVQAMKEQNEQLKRIATSLEIIAGQRGQWKLPKN